MCRGHVPQVQASKAHAIVRSAGTKRAGTKRAYFASIFARKLGLVFLFLLWSCFDYVVGPDWVLSQLAAGTRRPTANPAAGF
jgi:hypothetical protein